MGLTYAEKLRLPQWTERKAPILLRDEYRCQHCGTNSVGIDVHHKYYQRGLDPWEYPDDALITLCRPCHDALHAARDAVMMAIRDMSPHTLMTLAQELVTWGPTWAQMPRPSIPCVDQAEFERKRKKVLADIAILEGSQV